MASKVMKAPKTIDTRDKKNRKLTRKDVKDAAKKYKNWGRWGKDDEIGTLNFTTADHIVAAAKLVQKGKVMSLALKVPPGSSLKLKVMVEVWPDFRKAALLLMLSVGALVSMT